MQFEHRQNQPSVAHSDVGTKFPATGCSVEGFAAEPPSPTDSAAFLIKKSENAQHFPKMASYGSSSVLGKIGQSVKRFSKPLVKNSLPEFTRESAEENGSGRGGKKKKREDSEGFDTL
jgi:hypothetical protein